MSQTRCQRTSSLTEPLSPALHPQLHWACAHHLAKGSECKENRLSPYKYTYGHMHTSYTYTNLFSSLENTNHRILDPLLSLKGVLLTWKLELPIPIQNSKAGTRPWTQRCGLVLSPGCAAVAAQLTQQILPERWGSQAHCPLLCCYFTPWNNLLAPDTRNKRWGKGWIW